MDITGRIDEYFNKEEEERSLKLFEAEKKKQYSDDDWVVVNKSTGKILKYMKNTKRDKAPEIPSSIKMGSKDTIEVMRISSAKKKMPKLFNEAKSITEGKQKRPLSEIAREIYKDWGSKVNFAAKPYLEAMLTLNSINDMYMYDSARSIVAYFLSNARSWKGPKAKEIKKELKDML